MRRAPIVLLAAVLLAAGCGGHKSQSRAGGSHRAQATPTPRTDAASMARRARVPVLCYHQIREPTSADSAADRQYIVRPSVLDKQLGALKRAGYTAITGEQLFDHMARGAKLPRKPVLLTFDDASAGQYTRALPILRKHRVTATFFVMTVVLGKEGWLTRGQVRALDRAGMTIGAHTYDHKEVPGYAGADWKAQLDEPGRELRRIVGHPIRLFAYPDGAYTADAVPHLWSAGYRAAFQLADDYDRRHPLWNVRRIIVPELSGPQLLRAMRRDF
jgi:peptidoglycan/xylan/chitin deacetylase (PgdA/CDA1 family)